jgi:uncharacterized membrane protein YkvA (DUF1232 family)
MKRFLLKLQALRNEAYVLYLAFKHPRTPSLGKMAVGFIAAYALSPIDFIPDYIPGFGVIDELILIPLLVTLALRLIPPAIVEECREAARRYPLGKKLRLWTGVLILLTIWLLLMLYLIKRYWPATN